MATNYPGRSRELNLTFPMNVRISEHQNILLDEYAKKFNMSKSDIIREAITLWVNMNKVQEGK